MLGSNVLYIICALVYAAVACPEPWVDMSGNTSNGNNPKRLLLRSDLEEGSVDMGSVNLGSVNLGSVEGAMNTSASDSSSNISEPSTFLEIMSHPDTGAMFALFLPRVIVGVFGAHWLLLRLLVQKISPTSE
jgi:hypothetical protein